MLALIGAILLALSACGADSLELGDLSIDLFIAGLAFWAGHFAFAIAVPWPRRS